MALSGETDVAIANEEREEVTLLAFNSIQLGMSYDEVRQLFGGNGQVQTESTIPGGRVLVYAWKDASRTGQVLCTFQNDKLSQRSQTGLD